MTHRPRSLSDAQALLHQTIQSTGKDTRTIAMEVAVSVKTMVRMLKTCAGAAVVEANSYSPGSEAHNACMSLANQFMHDAKFFEENVGWLTDRRKSKKILDSAHPIPS